MSFWPPVWFQCACQSAFDQPVEQHFSCHKQHFALVKLGQRPWEVTKRLGLNSIKKKKKRKIKTGVASSVGILNPCKNCGIVTWTDHNLTAFHSFPYFPQVKGLTKFLSLVSPLHLFKLTHWFLRHLLWPLQVSSVSSTLSEQKLAKHQVPMQYLTYSFAVSIL